MIVAGLLFPGRPVTSDPTSLDVCAGVVTMRTYTPPPDFHLQALSLFSVFGIALLMVMIWRKYRREAARF